MHTKHESQVIFHTLDTIVKQSRDLSQNNMDLASAVLQALGKHGLHGLHVDPSLGGQGLDITQSAQIIRFLSTIDPGLALNYLAHNILCIDPIYRHGTPFQQAHYLKPLIQGRHHGALALTEPSHGSDALNMQCTVTPQGNDLILDGHKQWITNAPLASTAIIYARHAQHDRHIVAIIVDLNDPSIERLGPIDKIGMKTSITGELIFRSTRIKPHQILSTEKRGQTMLFDGLNRERVMLTFGPLGILDRVISILTTYLKTRYQFGKKLAEQPILRQSLAQMIIDRHASNALAQSALQLMANQELDAQIACACFEQASQKAVWACDQAIVACGANGYATCNELGQLAHDARLYLIGGGTTHVRCHVIAHEHLKGDNT